MGKVVVVQNPNISLDKEWKRTTPVEKEIVNVLGQKVTSSFNGRKYEVVCDATRDFPLVPFIIRFVAGLFAVLGTLGIALLFDCSASTVKDLFVREQKVRYIIEIRPKTTDPSPFKTEVKTYESKELRKWASIQTTDPRMEHYCNDARKASAKLTGPIDRSLWNHIPRWGAEDFNQQMKALPPFVFKLISNEAVPGIKVELLSKEQLQELCTEARIPLLTAQQLSHCMNRLSYDQLTVVTSNQLSQVDLSVLDNEEFIHMAPETVMEPLLQRVTVDTLLKVSKHFYSIHWKMVPDQIVVDYLEKCAVKKIELDSIFNSDGRDFQVFCGKISPKKRAELTPRFDISFWKKLGVCRSLEFLENCSQQIPLQFTFSQYLFPPHILSNPLSKQSEIFRQLSGKLLLDLTFHFQGFHWDSLKWDQVLEISRGSILHFNKLFNLQTELGRERFKRLPYDIINRFTLSNFSDLHWGNLTPEQMYHLDFFFITQQRFDLIFSSKTPSERVAIFAKMPSEVFDSIREKYNLSSLHSSMTPQQQNRVKQ